MGVAESGLPGGRRAGVLGALFIIMKGKQARSAEGSLTGLFGSEACCVNAMRYVAKSGFARTGDSGHC